ncbi:hypothetical protein A6E15_19145 [Natrinema saccharevitans]|uniref:Uncharacterized protein n=1 Tax=Natrinema saccharevitans TaxID=301967 RepID=A0A1S8ARD5_9EURY|nr:hypothetical protein [Natrinema saccharevitans]OLZ39081.1 hypothetical protein A6E15_19145 [Natrinema saccharevitans]
MSRRLSSFTGFLVAYLTAGVVQSTLIGGASVDALSRTLTDPLYPVVWPLFVIEPTFWAYTAVAILSGLGVLATLERSRLPITVPRRLPTPSVRHSAEGIVALLVTEVVARFTTAAAFVAHLHIWPPHRGEPDLSVSFYQDAIAFFDGYTEGLPYLVWAGDLLPEVSALPSGGPNHNHVLRGIGEIQFFDGVGFAIVVGYGLALVLSYAGVRLVSRWIQARRSGVQRGAADV